MTTKQMDDSTGAHISSAFFGHPKTVESLDETNFQIMKYYYKIIKSLKKRGYQNFKNLFGAPYDFRKLPGNSINLSLFFSCWLKINGLAKNSRNYFFQMLKSTIEKSYKENHNKKVVLISHSMGSALINWFLSEKDQHWKDTYIAGWISLNGAFAGSIKAFMSRTFGHSDLLINKYLLGFKNIANLLATFPSFRYLLPSKAYFGQDRVTTCTSILIYSNIFNLQI